MHINQPPFLKHVPANYQVEHIHFLLQGIGLWPLSEAIIVAYNLSLLLACELPEGSLCTLEVQYNGHSLRSKAQLTCELRSALQTHGADTILHH